MKKVFFILAPALMVATPAIAAEESAAPRAGPAYAHLAAKILHKKGRPPNWRRINHKINKRAKHAVRKGANPARVRKKAKAYKKKLYRRWKASK